MGRWKRFQYLLASFFSGGFVIKQHSGLYYRSNCLRIFTHQFQISTLELYNYITAPPNGQEDILR